MKKINFLLSGLLLINFAVFAANPKDSTKYANWQNKDAKNDKIWGVSTDKTYAELLAGKESQTVIVAVIDGGVDIEHEDLRNNIWVNEDEIPGNGIDDDNNGYIDDIHGWNFIGNENGESVGGATLEVTRLYTKYSKMFEGMSYDEIKESGKVDFDYYMKVVETYKQKFEETTGNKAGFDGFVAMFQSYDSTLALAIGKEDYTIKELKKFKPQKNTKAHEARKKMIKFLKGGLNSSMLESYGKHFDSRLNYHYNVDFDARALVGDNASNWDDIPYGNNDVEGPDAGHGTMCAGIIGAARNNGIGINGVADNVQFMCLRAVPDGDEWDKDVAYAIKYAIENGAQVINMSFGKSFSPDKAFVDKVISMAEANNVLLVHAAGNDSKNIDVADNFPNRYSPENEVLASTWMDIGASGYKKKKDVLVATFSNYGKQNVDIFAPGVDILTTAPDNEYDIASGTSFAAPMVSGVAALLKSYYPELTAMQLKEIILKSSAIKDRKVLKPGTGGKNKEYVMFSTLSSTGGLLNAYQAVQLAEKMTSN